MYNKSKFGYNSENLFFRFVNKQLKKESKCRPPKYILALPSWGQICTVSVLQQFTFDNFISGFDVTCPDTPVFHDHCQNDYANLVQRICLN